MSNTIQLGIPDYSNIIKKPMDLGTIRERFDNNYYLCADEAMSDFNQVFENCYIYNNPEDDIANMQRWRYFLKGMESPFMRMTYFILRRAVKTT